MKKGWIWALIAFAAAWSVFHVATTQSETRTVTVCQIAADGRYTGENPNPSVAYKVTASDGAEYQISSALGIRDTSGRSSQLSELPGTYRLSLKGSGDALHRQKQIQKAIRVADDSVEIAKCGKRR